MTTQNDIEKYEKIIELYAGYIEDLIDIISKSSDTILLAKAVAITDNMVKETKKLLSGD